MSFFAIATGQRSFALCHFFCRCVHTRFQFSVFVSLAFEVVGIEINTTVRFIRAFIVNDSFDKIHNLGNVFRDASYHIWFTDAQSLHVLKELLLEFSSVIFVNLTVGDARSKVFVQLSRQCVTTCRDQFLNSLCILFEDDLHSSLDFSKLTLLELGFFQGFFTLFYLFCGSARGKRFFQIFHLFLQLLAHRYHGSFDVAFDCTKILFFKNLFGIVFDELVLSGSQDNFVVNVGNVHLVKYVIMKVVLHDTTQNIEREVSSGMAHVIRIINCRTASVPCNRSVFSRNEQVQFIVETVVNLELRQIAVVLGRIPFGSPLGLNRGAA
mmetsp:Transcript_3278/g.7792  ORF Transcript_3278/g.7792 Transcript_3278/m.7792 type:complete len:324 (+) Transcript_3278:384-1355(+)